MTTTNVKVTTTTVANVQREVLEHARNVRVVDGLDELDVLAVSTVRGVVSK